MNKINIYILILVIFIFLFSCTEPEITNPYDPEYELPAPSNLNTDQLTVNTCKITWQDNAGNEIGYKIDRKVNNGEWTQLTELNENVTLYTDESVNTEDTFFYRVYSYAGNNNSNYSNEIYFHYAPEGFVFVQGGTFDMGDHYNEGDDDELPIHSVTLDDYYICRTEVTNQQVIDVFNWAYSQGYINCTSSSVTNNQGDSHELLDLDHGYCAIDWNGSSLEFVGSDDATTSDCPCILISWYGSVAYCNYESLQEGLDTCYDLSDWSCDFDANGYRLTTEAEWEYAARGGIHWTDDYRYSGCHDEADLPDYAWYNANSNDQTHPVGTKFPNQLDIYDMSGNVFEWCNDRYDSNYYSMIPPNSNNPTGPNSGSYRVLRGGGWTIGNFYCRVADRIGNNPSNGFGDGGFRFVKTH